MNCATIREAVSATLDGEDPGLARTPIDRHLADCKDCATWCDRAHELTRRARLGGPYLDRDLTAALLETTNTAAAPRAAAPRGTIPWSRLALAVTAVTQLAITVPLLFLGHDHDAGAHAAHELGSFDLALAIAFVIGAVHPRLSAGLAWPSCVAALGLAGTAMADIAAGQTPGLDELQHLVVVAGALLLLWQSRSAPPTSKPARIANSGSHTTATDAGMERAASRPADPAAKRKAA
jgi:predicted anti-sigma-YlaC factor YlaD